MAMALLHAKDMDQTRSPQEEQSHRSSSTDASTSKAPSSSSSNTISPARSALRSAISMPSDLSVMAHKDFPRRPATPFKTTIDQADDKSLVPIKTGSLSIHESSTTIHPQQSYATRSATVVPSVESLTSQPSEESNSSPYLANSAPVSDAISIQSSFTSEDSNNTSQVMYWPVPALSSNLTGPALSANDGNPIPVDLAMAAAFQQHCTHIHRQTNANMHQISSRPYRYQAEMDAQERALSLPVFSSSTAAAYADSTHSLLHDQVISAPPAVDSARYNVRCHMMGRQSDHRSTSREQQAHNSCGNHYRVGSHDIARRLPPVLLQTLPQEPGQSAPFPSTTSFPQHMIQKGAEQITKPDVLPVNENTPLQPLEGGQKTAGRHGVPSADKNVNHRNSMPLRPLSHTFSASNISSFSNLRTHRLRADSRSSTSSHRRSVSTISSDRSPTPTQPSQNALHYNQNPPRSLASSTMNQHSSNGSCQQRRMPPFAIPSPSNKDDHREGARGISQIHNADEMSISAHTLEQNSQYPNHSLGSSETVSVGNNVSVAKERGNKPAGSVLKNKLRKALSLPELDRYNSDERSNQFGRSSTASNSSSSDTSSNLGPKTPPSGVSPVFSSSSSSASVDNLQAQHQFKYDASSHTSGMPGRRFGLLNSKRNASTDNLSISSSISSASLMLRKVGNLGKIARKSSIRSLNSLFQRADKTTVGHGSDSISEFGVPDAITSTGTPGKSEIVEPGTAHITVNMGPGDFVNGAFTPLKAGMTPAEALVRKHQIAEEQKVKTSGSRMEVETPDSKGTTGPLADGFTAQNSVSKLLVKEKEKLKHQSTSRRPASRKWGLGHMARKDRRAGSGDSASILSSDAQGDAYINSAAPAVMDSRPSTVSELKPLVTVQEDDNSRLEVAISRPCLDDIQLDSWRRPSDDSRVEYSRSQVEVRDEADSEETSGRNPQHGRELSEPISLDISEWDGEPPQCASFFDDDTASFDDGSAVQPLERLFPEPEDFYDDGGHDGRSGQKVPDRPPSHARPAKGILKHPLSLEHLSSTMPAADPCSEAMHTPPESRAPMPRGQNTPQPPVVLQPQQQNSSIMGSGAHDDELQSDPVAPYSRPLLNSSEPILTKTTSVLLAARAVSGPTLRRKISFAQNLSVHTTWPGTIYDRRGDLATCNRLTPSLAQSIKEELNSYKLEEMEVHYMSRAHTHFFV